MAKKPIIQQAQLTDENGAVAVTVLTGGAVTVGNTTSGNKPVKFPICTGSTPKSAIIGGANNSGQAIAAGSTVDFVLPNTMYMGGLIIVSATASGTACSALFIVGNAASGSRSVLIAQSGNIVFISGPAAPAANQFSVDFTPGTNTVSITTHATMPPGCNIQILMLGNS